ncbi:colicin V production protein [Archangium sp. Cb G35]|uniref:CvpA family protein n=1 Tax=Archangium sp. Cb G35 TaxID=1920190 RepID=UPI000935DCD9|nr:CvpA family protein [Archangium sp. Cb G35]OJT20428.1 colicin V production protein [Archangium sp. Cb G35]
MTIDLIILGLVLLFAVAGAISGGAKQIANLVALAVAWYVSRKLGTYVGPKMAAALGGAPLLIGTVAGTMLVFITVLVAIRYALTYFLQRLFGGPDPDKRNVDGAIGFVLGGAKVALISYVVLSALVFAEQYIIVAGKRMGVSPKDSVSFGLARRYNLFEMTQFAAVKDMAAVAKVAGNPESARRMADNPAFKSLKQDPRFQRALSDKKLREALEKGDTQAALRSNLVLQLLQDPQFVARLGAAARASERGE